MEETARTTVPDAGALERETSTPAQLSALQRERLVAEIARKVRSELDLDEVLQIAVTETGRALGVVRCFIRLGQGGRMPVKAEWHAEGLEPLGDSADRLAVSNLAARERRTVAIADVENAPELGDESLGRPEVLVSVGARSALATPILVFGEMIGVFGLHRSERGAWSPGELSLAEAVAGEVGLAIHAARLLAEDRRRLEQQAALLSAAQVVTSDLRFESVLRHLVDEVATLFGADAADCWMFEPRSGLLCCRAVFGLPSGELGRPIAPAGANAAAIESGGPVLRRDVAGTEELPASESFAAFEEVMVAPISWLGEVRGVLGVYARERDRFDASQLELLDAFARFASLASHNAESFEEHERQAQIQQGFYRIAEVLGSPLSLAETLAALAEAAAEALGADSAVVLEPKRERAVLVGSFGVPAALAERLLEGLDVSATPFPTASREERIISSTALRDDDRLGDEARELFRAFGYEALLSAPVTAGRGEARAVVVLFREERKFSDEDIALARHVSRAARGALERSELFETERRARSLSERLATVGARLVTNLGPALVLDEVVREAPALVEGDAATVRLLEGDELVVRAAAGSTGGEIVGVRASSAAGLLGEVAQSRRAAAAEDVRATPQRARGDPLLAKGMAACVAVPMAAPGGHLLGVLSAYAALPRAWRPEEVQALAALAAVASAALSNADLYQRVAEEKERSEAILGNIADGIIAVDRQGQIVLWNPMAEEITGIPASEALGRRVSEILQRDLAADDARLSREREVSIVRGGNEVWLSLTEAVMRDSSGEVLGRIFAFRDVSAERAVEQMKSDFVAAVSHELRTPLTSIYGFAETLLRHDVGFGEEERETFLAYITAEAERLISIVDSLLSVARLEAGSVELDVVPTNVADVLRGAADRLAARADGGQTIVADVPERDVYVEADPARLADVVEHLLDNAIKFSSDGGSIRISARRMSDAVEIRVVDEGAGIPPGERERVVGKPYRSGTPVATPHATGISFFLARTLVAAMRGRIWVESKEGEGSSFVFELPLARGARE